MAKPRYKINDMVYSYQNPTVKRRVSHFREGMPGYSHSYKLALRDREGYSYSSNWINESSLHKRRA